MAIRLGIEQVKRDWDRLVRRVEAGEEVVICRWAKPVANMISFLPAKKRAVRPGRKHK